MSLTVGELVAYLDVNDRDYNRKIDAAESKFGGFVRNVKVAGGLAIAGALTAIGRTGMQEVMDASAGTEQLKAGLKSTGNVANVTIKSMQDLAGEIQAYSGQTDDSIVAAENMLLTFTKIRNVGADKIFDRATVAAADMAAKLGTDASSSAIMLGKALNDPIRGVTALQRVGVSFTEEQRKQIKAMAEAGDVIGAQKIILAELTTEFGGAARAAGESLPGQVEIARREFEDVSQELVTGLLPAIRQFLGLLRSLIPYVPTLVKIAVAFTGIWAAVKGYTILKGAVGAVRDIAGAFRSGGAMARVFSSAMGHAGGVSGGLAKTLGQGGALAIALAFTTTMIFKAVDAWQQYSAAAKQAEKAYQGAQHNASSAEQMIIDKYGKGSAQHKNWLQRTASARKGIEDDRYKKPWWDVTSWFGSGGDFIATRPQVIGVGDVRERVTITPLDGPGPGIGPSRTTNIYITGVPSRRQLEQLKRDLASVDVGGY